MYITLIAMLKILRIRKPFRRIIILFYWFVLIYLVAGLVNFCISEIGLNALMNWLRQSFWFRPIPWVYITSVLIWMLFRALSYRQVAKEKAQEPFDPEILMTRDWTKPDLFSREQESRIDRAVQKITENLEGLTSAEWSDLEWTEEELRALKYEILQWKLRGIR